MVSRHRAGHPARLHEAHYYLRRASRRRGSRTRSDSSRTHSGRLVGVWGPRTCRIRPLFLLGSSGPLTIVLHIGEQDMDQAREDPYLKLLPSCPPRTSGPRLPGNRSKCTHAMRCYGAICSQFSIVANIGYKIDSCTGAVGLPAASRRHDDQGPLTANGFATGLPPGLC